MPRPKAPKPAKTRRVARAAAMLTEEEQELWDHVAGTTVPIHAKLRVTEGAVGEEVQRARRSTPEPKHKMSPTPRTHAPQPTPPAARMSPAVAPLDRKTARKIANGRIEIEGRIDLHGLRESDAHTRLRGFLRQAQAAGKRTVLVITGKGKISTDDAIRPFDLHEERRSPGVLRRNVPRWLAAADLAAIVVSFTPAHSRHGGDGALYVYLRRSR